MRGVPGTPIAMETKFRYVLAGSIARFQNLSNTTLIC